MTNIQLRVPNWLDKILAWPILLYRIHKYGYPYRRIYLDEGLWTILDPQDYYRYCHFKWCLDSPSRNFYAARGERIGLYGTKRVRLHREIMNPGPGVLVDHRNGNSLDNRRENLRVATHSQNSCNKKKRKNTSSRFTGVSFDKSCKKWAVQIDYQKKRIWLGRFVSEIEAARAYDRAAIKIHGEFARLNFPREDYANELPPQIP